MFRTKHVDQVAEVGDTQTVSRRFPASSLVGAIIGAALLVIGIVVLLRGDVTGSWTDPLVSILGLDHTPLLGLAEVATGALLLIAALTGSRPLLVFFSAAMMIFGVVVLVQHESLVDDLGVQSAHGYWALGLGALLLVVTLMSTDHIVEHRSVSTVQQADVVEPAAFAAPVQQVQQLQPTTTVDPLSDRRQ